MISDDLIMMALGMPGAQESAHFGKRDFRVGEKIFMSLPDPGRAVLKFTPDQQSMVMETDPGLCAPVPGGLQAVAECLSSDTLSPVRPFGPGGT